MHSARGDAGLAIRGREIEGIDISDGEHKLRFRCRGGVIVIWAAEGDCCSESWWSDGYSLNALRGFLVTKVKEIPLEGYDVGDGRGRQDEDLVYGIGITTTHGAAVLAFRNSSNGYYGGNFELGYSSEKDLWREILGNEWSA